MKNKIFSRKTSILLIFVTLLGRFIAMAREVFIAYKFGASIFTDSYFFSKVLPNIFLDLEELADHFT